MVGCGLVGVASEDVNAGADVVETAVECIGIIPDDGADSRGAKIAVQIAVTSPNFGFGGGRSVWTSDICGSILEEDADVAHGISG